MDDIEVDIGVTSPRPWGSPRDGARAERTPWQRICVGTLGGLSLEGSASYQNAKGGPRG